MNRNTYSFDQAPHETMRRSSFDMSHGHKTTFNAADLIPIYLNQDILPGDSFSIKTNAVVRMQTLLDPIYDNMYLDTYFFFVPYRLVWNHTKEFFGENTTAPWTQTTNYTIPQITAPSGGWQTGTLADYMGIPINKDCEVSALPFRAYALICNEWFRNQNTTYPCDITIDDTTVTGVNTGNQVTDIYKGGKPYKAAKYKDYFTSALPSPQKGSDTMLPLGDVAPVITRSVDVDSSKMPTVGGHYVPLRFADWNNFGTLASSSLGTDGLGRTFDSSSSYSAGSVGAIPSNLWTDMQQVTGTSVNQLRLAFQIQKLKELDARGGSRYREIIVSHFGAHSSDARMQIPEYLGGHRITINVNSVAQTSASPAAGSTGTPQGHMAAYSVTTDSHGDFSASFSEHGIILGLACVRYHHTYQQGLARGWSRKTKYDYFWPILANVGEQPIYNKELFLQGTSQDNEVFGYNEAWADYRHMPSRTSGEMRSTASTSLDSWHLGDEYATLPSLSAAWIQEDKTPVDRCLAVTSSVANQFFADFWFDVKATRVMPVFSIPGLIDHH